jgi:hypothetical protein
VPTIRTFSQQKAGLTRAVKTGDRDRVIAETQRTLREWDSPEWAARYGVRPGAWPDDWSRWNRALADVGAPDIDSLTY